MTQQDLIEGGKQELVSDQDNAILVMIQRAASDPSVDVEKMERMLGMWERHQAHEAEKAFNRDFIALQNNLPEITEGGQIKHSGKIISSYARWDEDINPVIKPILAAHNFTLSFETDTKDAIHVTAHLIHRDGHSRKGSFTLPPDKSGAKNDVQAIGSSVSYAKRYAAGPLLNITTRGIDDDGGAGGGPERIDESQVADLNALLDEVGADRAKFSKYLQDRLKVRGGKIENIPAQAYNDVMAAVEDVRKRKAK